MPGRKIRKHKRGKEGGNMADISIIGAGSWGTALAVLLHKNGHRVTVWSIMESEIEMLTREREHKDKLPGVKLPRSEEHTSELQSQR